MQATLLSPPGKKTGDLQKELRGENITVENSVWKSNAQINSEFLNTSVLLLYTDPPQYEILTILPALRKQKYLLPIIILDEKENTQIKKQFLENGADAYFARPFHYRDLATQIKKIIYKKEILNETNGGNGSKWLRAFDVWLNLERRSVKRCKQAFRLRNKEFSLLEYFMINRGKILTRNSLLEHVWDRNANFASNTVDVHINRLRRKLDDPFRRKLIHTVHCIGYVFDNKS